MSQSKAKSSSRAWRRDWPLWVALTLLAIVTYIPFVFTVINSFKINAQFFTEFWLPALPLHPENYARAWPAMGRAIFNSFTLFHPYCWLLTLDHIGSWPVTLSPAIAFLARQILFFAITRADHDTGHLAGDPHVQHYH